MMTKFKNKFNKSYNSVNSGTKLIAESQSNAFNGILSNNSCLKTQISRYNNFDLIRLFAAFQVLLGHSIEHLDLKNLFQISSINNYFPGVMMFFTISGFLIFSSFDRNNNIKKYSYNRFLRIFPALWLCFILTIILLFCFKIINFSDIISFNFIKWSLAQITFMQFWTPDILRSWGVGNPNGSLWTIPVELQYYVLLPIIVILLKKIKLIYKFSLLAILSIIFNYYLSTKAGVSDTNLYKLGQVSLLPYLYCFLSGSIIYLYWSKLRKFLEGKAIFWFIVFISFCLISGEKPSYFPNNIQIISNLLLSIFTISMAYTLPKLGTILKGNDISYGVYIYHMLIINSLVALGYVGKIKYLFIAILAITLLSCLSWFFVEKKALSLKKHLN